MPVSLFYHYRDISDVESFASHLRAVGQLLHLAGRIRVSCEGINGTFGGTAAEVDKFHEVLLSYLRHPNIDFKVSEGSATNFPEGWKVRVCNELVTMGVSPTEASWREAAPHLDPKDFRGEILQALESCAQDVVVLDVRNHYEHAIGRFRGAVLPQMRQFSDFPAFVRKNATAFRDKRVLMYCTGGVRCERASAFLRKEGHASSVAQLKGGIDRFLVTYPCGGGVFEGKNLVFDTRMAISTTPPLVVGSCVSCETPWDSYDHNWRCSHCRSRVLICADENCVSKFYNARNGICLVCEKRNSSTKRS